MGLASPQGARGSALAGSLCFCAPCALSTALKANWLAKGRESGKLIFQV